MLMEVLASSVYVCVTREIFGQQILITFLLFWWNKLRQPQLQAMLWFQLGLSLPMYWAKCSDLTYASFEKLIFFTW